MLHAANKHNKPLRSAHILAGAAAVILLMAPPTFGWGNQTHYMIGYEVSLMDSVPPACLSWDYVHANNSPDIFTVIGPEFAHSDYRFAAILLELAGADFARQALAYGYFSHIAADRIVHGEFLPSVSIQHGLMEMAMSSVLYFENPDLQEAAEQLEIGYDPELIIAASELFLQRYGEGRLITAAEMRTKARLAMVVLIAQYLITTHPLFHAWAETYLPYSDFAYFHTRSIDSAYAACRAAESGKLSAAGPAIRADHDTREAEDALCAFGERLCSLGNIDISERSEGSLTILSADLPPPSDRRRLFARALADADVTGPAAPLLTALRSIVSLSRSSAGISADLLQCYPNPFNSSSTIYVEVTSPGSVDLSVYNVLGQRVDDLYSGNLPAGRYSFEWRGTDHRGRSLASGLYFVFFVSDNVKVSKKLVLLK
ncbi:MAG: T9SS type A sorting domain-containing protein [candidate division Zixibacteria bacterium]|nr:T9SS type A sorting domain-containing protein [candidate division Zixibacteria bacterium]